MNHRWNERDYIFINTSSVIIIIFTALFDVAAAVWVYFWCLNYGTRAADNNPNACIFPLSPSVALQTDERVNALSLIKIVTDAAIKLCLCVCVCSSKFEIPKREPMWYEVWRQKAENELKKERVERIWNAINLSFNRRVYPPFRWVSGIWW